MSWVKLLGEVEHAKLYEDVVDVMDIGVTKINLNDDIQHVTIHMYVCSECMYLHIR